MPRSKSNRLPDDMFAEAQSDSRSIASVYRDAVAELREGGIATPELDARLLLCHACGLSHEQFASDPERSMSSGATKIFRSLLERRLSREPVSRILGTREFAGLEFGISPETLDPRPDTETVVEAVLEVLAQDASAQPVSILDLGTGSGCILVSLLHRLPNATGVGSDISEAALDVARENAARHGVTDRVEFLQANWTQGLSGRFDIIISNPPYIPAAEIDGLQPEVSGYDPRTALDGGEDGLDAYRSILSGVQGLLKPCGWVVFELGAGQEKDVAALLSAQEGFEAKAIRTWHDLSGHVRCVAGEYSPRG